MNFFSKATFASLLLAAASASAAPYNNNATFTANVGEVINVSVTGGSITPTTTGGIVDAQTLAVSGGAVHVDGNNVNTADIAVKLAGTTGSLDGQLDNPAGDVIAVDTVTLTGIDTVAYNVASPSNSFGDNHTNALPANGNVDTTSLDLLLPAGSVSIPAGSYSGLLTVTVNNH